MSTLQTTYVRHFSHIDVTSYFLLFSFGFYFMGSDIFKDCSGASVTESAML